MILSYLSLIYLTNYYVVIIVMIAYGLGDGLGHLTVIKNAWRYFPNNKGLVNGIILGGLGLSAAFLNPIADLIINPTRISPLEDGFYTAKIGNKIESFFWFLIVFFSVLGGLAVVLSFPYNEMLIDSSSDVTKIIETKAGILKNNNDEEEEINNQIDFQLLFNENENEKVSYAYFSKENLQLSIFCFGTPCNLY